MTVIAGGSRSNGSYWTWHLQRTDGGQSVAVRDAVGLMGQDMGGWFAQMEAMAAGGNTKNYFYHFSLNPREDEALTPDQVKLAVATTLENLGLGEQPYFLVEHDKDGRSPHYHCIVLRVDLDTGKAIPDSHNYRIHMHTADELEQRFGHERTERGRGPNGPNPKGYEVQRGQKTGIDPKTVAAELKSLWRQCDSGKAFAAAIEERGYILAKGDRRDFVVIDQAGSDHALGRRVGAKAAEVRARMQAVDRDDLPTVGEARSLARERAAERQDRDKATAPDPSPPGDSSKKDHSAFELLVEERLDAAHGPPSPAEPMAPEAPKPEAPGNLVQELGPTAAQEAAPVLPEVAVAATAAESHEAPAERSAFDRFAADMKRAMRDGGGEPSAPKGWRWLAGRAPPAPAGPEPSVFGRFVEKMKDAMRAGAGEPETGDGLSLWQRTAAVFAAARDQATSWVRQIYQDVAGRFARRGDREPDDPGRER
jgi:hypothetical protein